MKLADSSVPGVALRGGQWEFQAGLTADGKPADVLTVVMSQRIAEGVLARLSILTQEGGSATISLHGRIHQDAPEKS